MTEMEKHNDDDTVHLDESSQVDESRMDRARARDAIDTLIRLRKGTVLGPDLVVRDLIDEGRR